MHGSIISLLPTYVHRAAVDLQASSTLMCRSVQVLPFRSTSVAMSRNATAVRTMQAGCRQCTGAKPNL